MCSRLAGASEGRAAEQHVLQDIKLFSAHGAERRGAPLVQALLACRGGETADLVYVLERAAPVACPHVVHRTGVPPVLSEDRDCCVLPKSGLNSDSDQLLHH